MGKLEFSNSKIYVRKDGNSLSLKSKTKWKKFSMDLIVKTKVVLICKVCLNFYLSKVNKIQTQYGEW